MIAKPPAQHLSAGESGPTAQRAGRDRQRRWARSIAVPLLVLVPAGYLVISAVQSHSPAAAAKLRTQMAGLVHDIPTPVQRRVYRVPIPPGATGVGFFEANSWQSSSLYVQFTTTPTGLTSFLAQLGTDPAHLENGLVSVVVPTNQRRRVGWSFPPGRRWAGITLARPGLHPDHKITVNLDDPSRPSIFVVSTISFAHHGRTPRLAP